MARRFVSFGLRRPVRDRGASGRGGGGGSAPQLPPLPAATVDYLHSELNVTLDGSTNVQTWTSIAGKFAPTQAVAAQRPTYGPDGSNFNGRPVVQAANAGNRYLASPGAAVIFANATRPYACGVIRMRAYAAGTNGIWQFTNTPITVNAPGLYTGATNTDLFFTGAATLSAATFSPTAPIFIETFLDAAGTVNLAANLASVGTVDVGKSITADVTRLSVGSNLGGSNRTDSSFAFLLAASAVPSVAERTALYQWAQGYWGVA